LDAIDQYFYPKMHSSMNPEIGVNLRFKDAANRRQRRRRIAGISLDTPYGG
jgi:hypothetical protein